MADEKWNGTAEPGVTFHISKKSGDWYSYRASTEEKEKVIAALQGCGIFSIPSLPGNCNSRVVVTIDGQGYTVYRPGCLMMPFDAAKDIAVRMGDIASVGVVGKVGGPTAAVASALPKQMPVSKVARVVPGQMSLF